jgi:acetaldehyde/propanal dehydrogenase
MPRTAQAQRLGVLMIDLTPAAIGPFCVPPVNLKPTSARAR